MRSRMVTNPRPHHRQRLAERLNLDPSAIFQAFLAMEMQGLLMRGAFEHPATEDSNDHDIEWCERRILQRIHRRTVSTLRKQVEAVTPAVYMRWLLSWQHLAPQTQLSGEEGVLEALRQLEGFEAPAIEWERTLLPARVANYDPRQLDALCLSGAVGWGRISPHPAWSSADGTPAPAASSPPTPPPSPSTSARPPTGSPTPSPSNPSKKQNSPPPSAPKPSNSAPSSSNAEPASPTTSSASPTSPASKPSTPSGSLPPRASPPPTASTSSAPDGPPPQIHHRRNSRQAHHAQLRRPLVAPHRRSSHAAPTVFEQARRTDAALESFARQLLTRYGILFRDLLARESNAPKWRDLLSILRRLEARGEIRGGRFVSGFGGEQFALPEAVESLRASRTRDCSAIIPVAAADPMNLVGIVIPGDRIPAVPGKQVLYRNGTLHSESQPDTLSPEKIPSTLPLPHLPEPAPTPLALF